MGTSKIADALRAAKPRPRTIAETFDQEDLDEIVAARARGITATDIADLISTDERRFSDDQVRSYLRSVGAGK